MRERTARTIPTVDSSALAVDEEEVADRFDGDVGGEDEEGDGDQPQRSLFAGFVVASAELAPELPDDYER